MISQIFTKTWMFGTAQFVGISRIDKFFFILSCVLLVTSIVMEFWMRTKKDSIKKNIQKRWRALFATFGVLGLIWSFLRYEYIVGISSHIVIIILYFIALIWAIAILKYYFGKYKRQLAEHEKQEQIKKYL